MDRCGVTGSGCKPAQIHCAPVLTFLNINLTAKLYSHIFLQMTQINLFPSPELHILSPPSSFLFYPPPHEAKLLQRGRTTSCALSHTFVTLWRGRWFPRPCRRSPPAAISGSRTFCAACPCSPPPGEDFPLDCRCNLSRTITEGPQRDVSKNAKREVVMRGFIPCELPKDQRHSPKQFPRFAL